MSDATRASVPESTRPWQRRGHPAPLAVQIRVCNAPARPERHVLERGACVLGAGRDADVVIEDATVSRRHAELELVPEGVAVRDLSSKNGTFYRDQRITSVVLLPGSVLRLGQVDVRLELAPAALEGGADASLERYGDLLGATPVMQKLFAMLARLEGSLVNVLLEGPTGTGKELAARAIHQRSRVCAGPFVAVNCGAIDRELVRSEFFGHRKGAFTGAVESRLGALEAAHGGTLFLDEIGELPLAVQPVLLRVLETGTLTRVGETEERAVKVRLIAATHRDLSREVEVGSFREDLFYRLAVARLSLPPLTERRGDIVPLARHFALRAGEASLPEDFLELLPSRSWPGNCRQLRNAVDAYLALGNLPEPTRARARPAFDAGPSLEQPYAEQKEALIERFTARYLERLLAHTHGNQSEASRISGIERKHLGKLLRRHGLSRERDADD